MPEPIRVGDCEVYHGDCLEVLPMLAVGSIDAIIADPPYSSGGQFRGDRMQSTRTKYQRSDKIVFQPEFTGDNRDQRSYLHWCALWLDLCLQVTKPGGVCCLFTDWRQLPVTTDALQAGGWIWRGIAVWNKTEAARPAKGRFRNQCEYIVWGSNGPMPEAGECLPGVWTCATNADEKQHVAAKPLSVMTGLVGICPPGGVVLDPFAGSGSTGEACQKAGRRCILIEKDARYIPTIERRLCGSAVPMFALAPSRAETVSLFAGLDA